MRDSEVLPHRLSNPALYILNSDSESGKGEHWCAVLYSGRECEFFDPFGMPPSFYGFEKILNTRVVEYGLHNPVCVQSIMSNKCGHHCLFYCFHRCRGYSLADIINMYRSGDVDWNDRMVLEFSRKFGNWYQPVV